MGVFSLLQFARPSFQPRPVLQLNRYQGAGLRRSIPRGQSAPLGSMTPLDAIALEPESRRHERVFGVAHERDEVRVAQERQEAADTARAAYSDGKVAGPHDSDRRGPLREEPGVCHIDWLFKGEANGGAQDSGSRQRAAGVDVGRRNCVTSATTCAVPCRATFTTAACCGHEPSSMLCSRTAVRRTLASWPWSAVSCSPSGRLLPTRIGIEMAGVPREVQGALMRASPVEASPSGAGPVAAGTRTTGVAL